MDFATGDRNRKKEKTLTGWARITPHMDLKIRWHWCHPWRSLILDKTIDPLTMVIVICLALAGLIWTHLDWFTHRFSLHVLVARARLFHSMFVDYFGLARWLGDPSRRWCGHPHRIALWLEAEFECRNMLVKSDGTRRSDLKWLACPSFPDTPWDWNICMHIGMVSGANVGIVVGIYSSPMLYSRVFGV